jgi:hypothetical protein
MLIRKFILADGRLTYNESGESGTQMLKFIHEQEQNEDLDAEVPSGDNLYEDQSRKQPRNLSTFDQGTPAQKPDIVVKVKRSDSKPYFDKYHSSKGKGQIVSPSYDDRTAPITNVPTSKILLTVR